MRYIKFGLKILLFLFGILLIGGFFNYFGNNPQLYNRPLTDITIREFTITLQMFIGVYITTNMLKGGNITKLMDKEKKEKKEKQ